MWFHHCNDPVCCPGRQHTGDTTRHKRGRFTIDLHCHALIPAVESLVAGAPQKLAEPSAMLQAMGEPSVRHNQLTMLPIAGPRLTRIEERLADMDAMGVDVQLISPSPTQYYYWAEPELARKLVRLINTGIAETCAQHPQRLAGLGTVALQHPDLALEQLDHAVRTLGLKGVEISTSVNGRELDDPSLRTFWTLADALGALVFIHPFGTSLGPRTATHYLQNTVGQPLETTIALSRLIFSGVLDARPGLKVLAAHGGGYLPTSIGRSDHAFAVRPEAATEAHTAPGEQLKRIWFDTVVYDPLALRHLIERVGASQVVIGTDYPFDMGYYDVHELVDSVPGLSDAERGAILGGNAAKLINWKKESA
jgi:aminocarboxymuconate-semialdehyde decarboxylase